MPTDSVTVRSRHSSQGRLLEFLWAIVGLVVVQGVARSDDRIEGFTQPYRQIELAVGEPGVLAKVHVMEGSRVEEGQVVAQLDTSVLERTLEIARQRSQFVGALQAAQAEFELREKYLQQLSQLRDRGHATQRELDRAQTDLKVAEARVAMEQEELSLQRLECRRIEAQIEHRIVRSPINGVISEVLRDAGESFMASDPRVVTIVQLDKLRAKFPLEPNRAQSLKSGQAVELNLDADSAPVPCVVESVSPVMDAKSATFEVTVAIDNPDESLPSGARCWLQLQRPTDQGTEQTQYTSAQGHR
jgi:RND family efflux transporter MFP subunit